jgi:lipopolysaccharide export system permease protein
MNKTSDTTFRNDSKMLSIRQLTVSIDSLKKVSDSFSKRLAKEVNTQFQYPIIKDSNWKKVPVSAKKIKNINEIIPDSLAVTIFESAINIANILKNAYQFTGSDLENKRLETRFSEIEWHRKFSFSLACLVLFFIGAPLGSIIRKGGLGMPLVVAIIFFILFHLLNIFGEKFAKEGITSVFFGMWLSIIVLVPVGVFITYKAMHDSQLFNKEFYTRVYRSINAFTNAIVNKWKGKLDNV